MGERTEWKWEGNEKKNGRGCDGAGKMKRGNTERKGRNS